MQLSEDYWAFNFDLTGFHLFQQKLMPALHDSDVILVVMLLQTAIIQLKLFINFRFQSSLTLSLPIFWLPVPVKMFMSEKLSSKP